MKIDIIKHGFIKIKPFFKRLVTITKTTLVEWFARYKKQRSINRKKLLDKKLIALASGKFFPHPKNIFFLPRLLGKLELRIFRVLLVFFLISSVYLLRSIFIQFTLEVPRSGGEYREGVVGKPRFINPLYALANQADNDIASLIFSSLFKFNKNGEVVPDVTESLEIQDNGKKYIIKIKKNIFFHDGAGLTSSDVAETINFIKNKDYKSQLRGTFGGITLGTPDDYTVEFRLEQPNSTFTSLLTFGILPRHLWKDINGADAQLAILNIKPIGSGSFRFNSLTKTALGTIHSITLEANPAFYDKKPNINKIAFTFFDSQTEALDALKNKDIDALAFFGAELPRDLKRRADLKFYKPRSYNYSALFFNLSRGHAGVPAVRKALQAALPRAKLYENIIKGTGLPMAGPIPPELLAEPRQIPNSNLDEAHKILDGAGWVKGADGVRKKIIKAKTRKEKDREEILEINLVTTDDSRYSRAAEIIKEGWEVLGVKVNLEVLPLEGLREVLRGRSYDVLLYGQALAQDLNLYPFWHSSEINFPGLNLSLLNIREVDVLLEKARKEQDFKNKLPYYQELETIFTREIPAIFLWSQSSYYVVSDKIKGIRLGRVVNPADRFANVTEWYIKSKRILK